MGESSISFRDYVKKQRVSNLEREFVANVTQDPKFPSIKSWGELRIYLNGRAVPHELFVAGRTVWRSYRDHLKRRPNRRAARA
jgi:hypothetical protein